MEFKGSAIRLPFERMSRFRVCFGDINFQWFVVMRSGLFR